MPDSIEIIDPLPDAGLAVDEPGGDFGHSIPLRPYKASASLNAALRHVLDTILAEYEATSGVRHHKGGGRNRRREALRFLVLNLFMAWRRLDPESERAASWTRPYVAYPRKASVYSHDRMLKAWHLPYRATIWAADRLLDLRYAEGALGWKDEDGRGFLSRIRATPRLMELMLDRQIKRAEIYEEPVDTLIEMKAKPVKVRNKKTGRLVKVKRPVDVSARPETRKLSQPVRRINEMLDAANVVLCITREERVRLIVHNRENETHLSPMPNPFQNHVRRIFNNDSFDHGGRFYGHWVQNLPRWMRKGHLTMNGKPTVERDFKAYHITLLYRRHGWKMPDQNPYYLPGWHMDKNTVKAVKRTINTLINAEDRDAARKSILFGPDSIARECGLTAEKVDKMIADVLVKHADVAKDLEGTDSEASTAGVELQSLDSKIAQSIMLRLWAQGIPCVPLHDSFIVAAEHEPALSQAMDEETARFLGEPVQHDLKYGGEHLPAHRVTVPAKGGHE